MDIIIRIAVLLLIMLAFITIFNIWAKLKDVDFRRLEIEVCEVLKMKNTTQDCRDRCCSDCPQKDSCQGNSTCAYCKKLQDGGVHPGENTPDKTPEENDDGRF